ncbi:DNA-binding proteins Bright/BRCAA1/RBP1 and proteins containing BRIGHT domain [Sporothrix curviconia]|uniref:DNA-binding proteins Bright/BRCAA1/RBP1 and proteins containing BRIGHT domain n=1 Tax=Sporothrix curviconia TaxID=1260050 RepID=A0ABP0CDV9_9PEZI
MAAATERGIQATSPRDTFTGVAARSVPVTRTHPRSLPTPPNSISPALPPHGLKAQLQKAAKLEPIDSDLDLHDLSDDYGAANTTNSRGVAALAAAAEAAAASAGGTAGSPPFESTDSISPAMLAKFHLPEILLNHGPLAIRYIIGHLTASVPGFSFIPPAKSRRLVVAALEGRGNGGEGGMGGLEGDVEFQKVSWGVWGAKRVGGGGDRQLPSPPPATQSSSLGIPITNGGGGGGGLGAERLRQHAEGSGALYRDVDLKNNNRNKNMMEDEVDRMSMDDGDGPASASCSEAPDEDMEMDDDPDNLTDDEDWGAVGAAALRAESYSASVAAGRFGSPIYMSSCPYGSFSHFAGTAGSKTHFSFSARASSPLQHPALASTGFTAFQGASDEQEREAIEGLLRLGSV